MAIRAYILFAVVALRALWADSLFLTVPVEAQYQSLGNAGVALAQGTAAMRYNPAGLGLSGFHELSLNYLRMGAYLSANSVYYTHSFAPYFAAGVFATALYLNRGFILVEDFEEKGTELSMVNAELGASAGYEILPNLAMGSTLRYFRLQLGPQISQSFGADFGIQYVLLIPSLDRPQSQLRLGSALRNLGPSFDFYSGGQKERQPLMYRLGLSHEVLRYVTIALEYSYNVIENSSYHLGFLFLPDFYISPRLGLQYDFSGISYTLGSGFRFQKGDDEFGAHMGLSLGHGPNGGDFFVNVMYRTTHIYLAREPRRKGSASTFWAEEELALSYEPSRLVSFRSAYKGEKLQGIIISTIEAQGYLQKNHRLRRVAIQPEDEIYLREMEKLGQRELKLTKRKMGLWLKLESFAPKDVFPSWEQLSAILEQNGRITTMLGDDLQYLNANPNAPLKAEWRLELKIVTTERRKEIRSVLYELYEGTMVAARNVPLEDDLALALEELGEFYENYLSQVDSYYLLRLYP
ncbi:MAG: hypothetical protein NZM25_09595 [Leptospiraceae bacterium]|nr:hypothetical protein [Leptospiraceae bacterium]MDW8306411.1 hypothetical protein [Leptospiraceae bacterium]